MGEIYTTYELKTLNLSKDIGRAVPSGSIKGNSVNTISLKASFQDLYLFHNIDDTVTSGSITIREQGNLIKVFPIIGWERLDIEFTISSQASGGISYTPYKRSFFIYAIDEMSDTGDTKMYTLHFADLSALLNVASRIEHRYVGKAESIISEICNSEIFSSHGLKNTASGSTNAINLGATTSTRFDLDLIAPSWKPFDFINRVAKLAVSSNGTFNDCLFFQQTDGTFYFTDWITLLSQSPVEFKKRPRNNTTLTSKYTINEYTMKNLYNTQSQAMSGMFGTVTKIFDMSNMSIHTFLNYYYSGDVESSTPSYSATKVDRIPEQDKVITPNYIDTLMKPYQIGVSGDPRFSAIKMSPVACIQVKGTGFSQTDIERMVGTNYLDVGVSGETAQYAYANGLGCNLNMRTKSVILSLNPCTDLKLGQVIQINMQGVQSEKTDIQTIEEFLNGTWFIGKIKYHLTLSEIEVDTECYSTSLNLRG